MAEFENYAQFSTKKVARTLELAATELVALRQNTLTPDFILLALLGQPDAEPLRILERLLPNVAETVVKLRSNIQAHYQLAVPRQGNQILVTQEINDLFRLAHEEARQMGDGFIATGTLFLALFDPLCGGVAERLREAGLNHDPAREARHRTITFLRHPALSRWGSAPSHADES